MAGSSVLIKTSLGNCQQHRNVPDARLAALAIEHGLVLATHDRGFARFEDLRWELPLA